MSKMSYLDTDGHSTSSSHDFVSRAEKAKQALGIIAQLLQTTFGCQGTNSCHLTSITEPRQSDDLELLRNRADHSTAPSKTQGLKALKDLVVIAVGVRHLEGQSNGVDVLDLCRPPRHSSARKWI
jgi:hypothetical protein